MCKAVYCPVIYSMTDGLKESDAYELTVQLNGCAKKLSTTEIYMSRRE